ncbi:MAG: tetratricopeptide repeat protein [Sphingobacteriaceae bacterium]
MNYQINNFSSFSIKLRIVLSLCLSFQYCFAFKGRDSLERKYKLTNDHVQKGLIGAELIKSFTPNYDSIELKGNELVGDFALQKNKFGQMISYFTLCRSGVEFAKYEVSRMYAKKAIAIANQINNDTIEARTWLSVGFSYYSQGDFQMGIGSYIKAIPICEKQPHNIAYQKVLASAYNGLGLCFSVKPFPNYDKALDYYLKALKIDEATNNTRDWGLVLIRLGILYTATKDYVKAEKYLNEALAFAERSKMAVLQKWAIESVASLQKQKHEYTNALKSYVRSLQISKKANEVPGIISSYINISETYFGLNEHKMALIYTDSAYKLCEINKIYEPMFKVNALRSDIYKAKGEFENALLFYKKSVALKDSLFTERSNNNIQELETRYKTQDQEKELIEKTAALKIQIEKSEKQAAQRNFFIVGILLLLIIIAFVYWQYVQKNKANAIIRSQKLLVESKNKDITDSIKYAKKIQEAILPPEDLRTQLFPDSFVFYQPKDIVSGDFYWYTQKNNKKIFAAVDCTGHGVPGAFMSMIGNAYLNEIVNEKGVTKTSEILDMLKERVVESLKQSGNENKDGMDIALIAIDETNGTVEFSGANNPCWIINKNELVELKGDSQPIGYHLGILKPFTAQQLKISKGDSVYIFTDGYADQFGGANKYLGGKKFKNRQLKELFLKVNDKGLNEQCEIIKNTFENWKGELEQVDDVCIIGIRL